MMGGRAGSASGDLSRSLLTNYKKEDKEFLEKQRQLWFDQE
jgi:hypothetical protein